MPKPDKDEKHDRHTGGSKVYLCPLNRKAALLMPWNYQLMCRSATRTRKAGLVRIARSKLPNATMPHLGDQERETGVFPAKMTPHQQWTKRQEF